MIFDSCVNCGADLPDIATLTAKLEAAQTQIAELQREVDGTRAVKASIKQRDWDTLVNDLAAAQAEIAARDERIAELLATADAERKIVSRIWERLGSPKYEDLKGRSIYDLIDDIQQERDTARARVRELEAALAIANGRTPWPCTCSHFRSSHTAPFSHCEQCDCKCYSPDKGDPEPAPDVAALERAVQALLDCHGERPDAWIALRSALASATTEPAPDVEALERALSEITDLYAAEIRADGGRPTDNPAITRALAALKLIAAAQQPGAAGKDAND